MKIFHIVTQAVHIGTHAYLAPAQYTQQSYCPIKNKSFMRMDFQRLLSGLIQMTWLKRVLWNSWLKIAQKFR